MVFKFNSYFNSSVRKPIHIGKVCWAILLSTPDSNVTSAMVVEEDTLAYPICSHIEKPIRTLAGYCRSTPNRLRTWATRKDSCGLDRNPMLTTYHNRHRTFNFYKFLIYKFLINKRKIYYRDIFHCFWIDGLWELSAGKWISDKKNSTVNSTQP